MTQYLNTVIQGDTIEEMRKMPDKSVDMILCDLPYGTTSCKWDTIIPFEPLWAEYERIIKDNGAVVLTASQPFTSALIMSRPKLYKHTWVWNKALAGNGILAKVQPLKIHEDVVVFAKGKVKYSPIMRKGKGRYKGGIKDNHGTFSGAEAPKVWSDEYYPTTILDFSGAGMRSSRQHPTQKPVALFEYLIRTYTNPGEVVLDNCIGSGTTAVAAINTGRQFIGIEREPEYVAISNRRIEEARAALDAGTDAN